MDNTTTPSITDLTTGAQISDVPTVADRVLVRGNVPAGVSLPTSGLITTVENRKLKLQLKIVVTIFFLTILQLLFRPMLPVEVLLLLSVCRMVTNMPR